MVDDEHHTIWMRVDLPLVRETDKAIAFQRGPKLIWVPKSTIAELVYHDGQLENLEFAVGEHVTEMRAGPWIAREKDFLELEGDWWDDD